MRAFLHPHPSLPPQGGGYSIKNLKKKLIFEFVHDNLDFAEYFCFSKSNKREKVEN